MPEAVVDIVGRMAGYNAAVETMPATTDRAAAAASARMSGRIEAGVKKVGQNVDNSGKKIAAALGAMVTLEMVRRLGSLAASTRDWAKELQVFKTEGLVGPKALDEITMAADGLRSVQLVGKAAAVAIGEELAPSLAEGARYTVALGLAGLDAFKKFSEGKDVLHELAVWLTGGFVKAILAPATGLAELVNLMAKIADVAGMDGIAGSLRSATQGYDDFTRSIANTAVGSWAKSGKREVDDLTGGMDGYLARADKIIGKEGQLRTAKEGGKGKGGKDAAQAARDEAKALQQLEAMRDKSTEDTFSDQQKVWAGLDKELEAINATAKGYEASAAVQGAAEAAKVAAVDQATREILKLEERALEEERKQREADDEAAAARHQKDIERAAELSAARLSYAQDTAGRIQAIAEMQAQEGKKGAKAAAAVAKGAAVFNLGLQVFETFGKTMATFGAAGLPLAFFASGLVAAQGAMAMAAAPPSFFRGSDPIPSDTTAQLHAGEQVLNRRETRELAPAVDAVRSGQSMGGGEYVWMVDRKVLADASGMEARRGGKLSDELTRRGGRLGIRNV